MSSRIVKTPLLTPNPCSTSHISTGTQLKLLSSNLYEHNYHVAGPNVFPGGNALNAVEFASAVFKNTVLPHHVPKVFAPIVPFLGYSRMKKMSTVETATPESRAADRMSDGCKEMLKETIGRSSRPGSSTSQNTDMS